MSEDLQEFEKIRAGVEAATDVLASAIEKYGGGSWDYVIAAIPVQRPVQRVALMSSVMPDILPKLFAYLHMQLTGDTKKIVEINGVPQDVKPS